MKDQTPKQYMDFVINNIIEKCNSKSKIFYDEVFSNKEVVEHFETLCQESYIKHNDYPFFISKGIIDIIKKEFPTIYEKVGKQYLILNDYSDKDIEEANKIIKNESSLLYCFNTIISKHIREKEILLLLLFSGVSSGFKDRKVVLHIQGVGKSGSGKSSSMKLVSKIFSNTEIITSSSSKSQFYKAQSGEMVDKGILIFDESENSKEGEALMRTFTDMSSGNPTHETVTPDHKFNRIEIEQINSVWKNSINTTKGDEGQLSNRFLIYNVDETEYQDTLVYNKALSDFGFGQIEDNKELEICKIITDLIKNDTPKIFIPYIDFIESNNKSNRRTIIKFLALVYSVTLFNRFQRTKFSGFIISRFEDFEIAKIVWNKINKSEALQLPNEYILILAVLGSKKEMNISELSDHPDINISQSTIRRRLKEMKEEGLVDFIYKDQKQIYSAFQKVSEVSIQISKDKFTIDSFKQSISILNDKINKVTFQDVKKAEVVESNIDLDKEYNNIINELSTYEKLKSIIDIDNKDTSKDNKTIVEGFQDNEKQMKSDENQIEVINLN
jgi:DNA-binding transcriptional ArsR family regulator